MKRLGIYKGLLLIPLFFIFPQVSQADATPEFIQSFDVDITVNEDASIDVREHITYNFGSEKRHGIFRTLPTAYLTDDNIYLQLPIEVVSVTDENGRPHEYEENDYDDTNLEIKIGDPNKKITGVEEYIISYHVDNVINGFSQHDELFWNVTGTEWNVGIDDASVNLTLPEKSAQQRVTCYTGVYSSTAQNCDHAFTSGAAVTAKTTKRLSAYEGMTVVVGFDKGMVELPAEVTVKSTPPYLDIRVDGESTGVDTGERIMRIRPGVRTIGVQHFTYDPFAVTQTFEAGHTYTITADLEEAAWAPLFQWVLPFFLLILTTLGLFWTWLVKGRDHEGRATVIPQYEAPDGLTAGEVGVLVDQKVHRQDISASLIQLAVRGYIHITKEEKKKVLGIGGKDDYTLRKEKSFSAKDAPELQPHERKILKGIFGSKAEVKLADLTNKFYTHLPKIKDDLYDSVVTHGYFTKHPNKVRRNWRIAAILGFVLSNGAGIAMTAAIESPVYGGVLSLISIQLLVYSFIMPQRTKKGAEAQQHVLGLKKFMQVTEEERMKFHFAPEKIHSSKELFEALLPYAMVLKVEKEWAKQFPELEAPGWYSGSGPYSTLLFINTMSSFSSAAGAAAVSVPSSAGSGGSGFSGGSSGGGFGGGGGGSW